MKVDMKEVPLSEDKFSRNGMEMGGDGKRVRYMFKIQMGKLDDRVGVEQLKK